MSPSDQPFGPYGLTLGSDPMPGRFAVVPAAGGATVRVDTWTGQCWLLTVSAQRGRWQEINEPAPTVPQPPEEPTS